MLGATANLALELNNALHEYGLTLELKHIKSQCMQKGRKNASSIDITGVSFTKPGPSIRDRKPRKTSKAPKTGRITTRAQSV